MPTFADSVRGMLTAMPRNGPSELCVVQVTVSDWAPPELAGMSEASLWLEHTYTGLAPGPDGFAVTLRFRGTPRPLWIPYADVVMIAASWGEFRRHETA